MAPRVEFHTGVADDVGFACRLLRKAYQQGARVQVHAPGATLARLDRELWTFAEREFIPHLRLGGPGPWPAAAALTPLWLLESELPADLPLPAPPVLVNLGAPAPSRQGGLARIIEVVALDADDEQRGRARWRAYRALGLEVVHHASRT